MCQIHVVTQRSFKVDEKWINHLRLGAKSNSDGFACLLINEDGEHSLIRTMKWDNIESLLILDSDWKLAVIHQRFTTQGNTRMHNTHLWEVGHKYYCHNGILSSPEAHNFDVDSQLIGSHLSSALWEAIEFCQTEKYANVIMVDMDEGKYIVSRSKTGSLYTDGKGQYSTDALVGVCDKAVENNSVTFHEFEVDYSQMDYDWGSSYTNGYGYQYSPNRQYKCPICKDWNPSIGHTVVTCRTCTSVFEITNPNDPYSGEVYYDATDTEPATEGTLTTTEGTLTTEEKRNQIAELDTKQIRAIVNADAAEYSRLEKLMEALNYNATVTTSIEDMTDKDELENELDMLDTEIALLKDELTEALAVKNTAISMTIQQDLDRHRKRREEVEYHLFNSYYGLLEGS